MQQRSTFNKREKLKSRKRIELLFKQGKSFSVFPYRVYFIVEPVAAPEAPDSMPAPRVAIQAGFGAGSRHFKKAVDRNRIKRLGREAYRLQKAPLLSQLTEKKLRMDVFFIYTGKELPDYQLVSEKIGVVLQKLLKETA